MISLTATNPARQRGATLIVSLLFLVVLTVLGLAAMSSTTLEERMARNARDYNLAFQAAEAALRDARKDLVGVGSVGSTPRAPTISGATGFIPNCGATTSNLGLCQPNEDPRATCSFAKAPATIPSGNPVWVDYLNTRSVAFGTYTLAVGDARLARVAQQPRYLIEALPDCDSFALKYVYRITAQGFGANANTQAIVQEIVRL